MPGKTWAVPDRARGTYVNIDGDLIHAEDATASPLDRNFLYSDGVFESMQVYRGRLLLVDRHLDRLFRSATAMKFDLALSKDDVKERVLETLEASEMAHGMVRIVVTRGVGPQGLVYTDEVDGPIVYVIPQRLARSEVGYGRITTPDARIVSTTATRPESIDPRIKSTNYVNNVLAERELLGTGADYAIMLDEHGNVAEAHVANVFVHDERGTLRTPPTTYTLGGITREVLLELADGIGMDVEVGTLTPYDLFNADSLILCSSRLFASVRTLNERPIRDAPSQATSQLADAYYDYVLTEEFVEVTD